MLKSIAFGDLERPFSGSEWSDWVYLTDLYEIWWRHFLIQPSRQSAKLIRVLVLFVSVLSLSPKSTLIKCWDPYVNPGCKFRLGFCGGLYFLPQHVDPVTSSYRAGFQFFNYTSVSPGFRKGSMMQYVGSLYRFLILFPVWLFWQMELTNMAGFLQKTGNTDSRACNRSQV